MFVAINAYPDPDCHGQKEGVPVVFFRSSDDGAYLVVATAVQA